MSSSLGTHIGPLEARNAAPPNTGTGSLGLANAGDRIIHFRRPLRLADIKFVVL